CRAEARAGCGTGRDRPRSEGGGSTMLDAARNQALTEVGPGTPMGELMRRHWHPIAAVKELEDNPVKAVRLLGEDLVLYRDRGGKYGLVDRHCAHRSADLSYGL